MSVVYTTAGGRRFHADYACRALLAGRSLSDADCGCDEFCNHRLPTTHLREPRQPLGAVLAGYTACRVCVPPADALPATEQTYGHEPVTETGYYGHELVCARCNRIGCGPYASALWPCTSAAVLGLVITDADRWNARYPIGTPVRAWPDLRTDEPTLTRTRTPAWHLGHGASVVSVDGHAGGIALTHVEAL